jgi:hypothetical protein
METEIGMARQLRVEGRPVGRRSLGGEADVGQRDVRGKKLSEMNFREANKACLQDVQPWPKRDPFTNMSRFFRLHNPNGGANHVDSTSGLSALRSW